MPMKPAGPKARQLRLNRHGPARGGTAGFGPDASWLKQWRLSFSSLRFLLLEDHYKWERSRREKVK